LDHRGSGFFSNVSSVLCHLKIAKDNDMIPVIDFQNFPTLYNEKSKINNTTNSWEYYFSPVSKYSLKEVYQSKNVFFSSGLYPKGMSYSITENPGLFKIYSDSISLQSDIHKKVADYSKQINFKDKVLGIHFRGQEQKYATGHSFPPTERQMFRYTDEIMRKYQTTKIFLVTEDIDYLNLFIKRYGDRVYYSDMFRTRKVNAYKLRPRKNHMYLLGKEVLVDAILLSKCTGLLCGDSNVSEIGRFLNNNKYKFIYKIDNGINSNNPLIARHLYAFKKYLPPAYGGLKDKLTIIKNNQ
ncbi:MAG: hypothetical protein AAB895_03540, partial [Patescibacteria group bacterium]